MLKPSMSITFTTQGEPDSSLGFGTTFITFKMTTNTQNTNVAMMERGRWRERGGEREMERGRWREGGIQMLF